MREPELVDTNHRGTALSELVDGGATHGSQAHDDYFGFFHGFTLGEAGPPSKPTAVSRRSTEKGTGGITATSRDIPGGSRRWLICW